MSFFCEKNHNKENKNKQKMEIEEKKSVKSLAIEYLQKWDIKYEIVKNDYLLFKYQGGEFFIRTDEDHPNFLNLVMPYIYIINNDRIEVLEAMLNITGRRKLIKAFLDEDDVWLCVDMLMDPSSNIDFFEEMIRYCFDCLFDGKRDFFRYLLKE
jgi:hypothetical protein